MKVVISNFSKPVKKNMDFKSYWADFKRPPRPKEKRLSLFEYRTDWGFHIYSIGVYLLDEGIADEVEFWSYSDEIEPWSYLKERTVVYHPYGILRLMFYNEKDIKAYLKRFGYPDLYINHGCWGQPILKYMKGKAFRVHVPALRLGADKKGNFGAECYLVDSEKYLDKKSMLYMPVVNTEKIYPADCGKERDFVYLASFRPEKRHDIILKAIREKELTGHFHPVEATSMDLKGANITTSNWDERDVVKLLQTSKIAVYPGDNTSNPAAMWECVAAGLPIVINENIEGGKHLVISGITGELASEDNFYETMKYVLNNLGSYRPREYFMEHWDSVSTIKRYLNFFRNIGWRY